VSDAVLRAPGATAGAPDPSRGWRGVAGWIRNPWGKARFLWGVTWAYIAWSIVPLLIAIRISFNAGRSLVEFQGWSLIWWWSHPTLSAWHRPELRSALFQSVRLAGLTVVIAVPLGVAFALALDRWRGPLPASANFLMAMSWITPELMIGVALFLVFVHLLTLVHLGTGAQVLGLITFEMTYPVIIVRARLLSFGRSYEEAAMDLGASPLRAIWRVMIPLLAPAIIASAMIVFVDAIDDFVVAAWLSGGSGSETVAIRIYSDARGSVTPALDALGSMMLVVSMVILFLGGLLYRWLARRQRGEGDSGITDFVSSQA
jgi:spermidine/putrescine transport system permease protein